MLVAALPSWLETAGTVAAISAAVVGWIGLLVSAVYFRGLRDSAGLAIEANGELRSQVADFERKLGEQESECDRRIADVEAAGREQVAHLQGQLDAVSSRIVGDLVDRVGSAVEGAVESGVDRALGRVLERLDR